MTRRRNATKRRSAYRDPKEQILVTCGGIRTEPKYFEGLKKQARNPAVKVKIISDGVDPQRLVDYASTVAQRGGFDSAWCVVDVDEFDLAPAIKTAQEAGVNLAVSNPCFEYWLLIHFQDCHTCLNGPAAVTTKLRKHVPHYDKTDLRFEDFTDSVDDAVRRAKQRCPAPGSHEHQHNPSTRVWELVEAIKGT